MKNLKISMTPQVRSTIEKTEEGRINFQNKHVSSQNKCMRKEEGATVAATPYLISAGRFVLSFCGPDGQ